MGNTFTVEAWAEWDGAGNGYSYATVWRGESFLSAIFHLVLAKRSGYGCVTLYYR
ncbi:hypothetical protein ACUYGA_16865 [Metapseudomonas otitidis]|uniref:hypothetical protein n=1 Tax=Metapseudomonas otitidis TaxID=319939 RepID=UPI0040559894